MQVEQASACLVSLSHGVTDFVEAKTRQAEQAAEKLNPLSF
jgi:hypothetical protein